MSITCDIQNDMGAMVAMGTTKDTTAPRGMAHTLVVALSPRGTFP